MFELESGAGFTPASDSSLERYNPRCAPCNPSRTWPTYRIAATV
jgi:hypothetical protein